MLRAFPLLALLGLGMAAPSVALALDPVNNSLIGDVAIHGYDPVAYFLAGKPTEGSSSYSFTWQGAVWHFASASNRDLFARDPGRYAPQYGGYCAWAVSQNDTADIDPNAWKIVDGKLYLNYSLDIQHKWEANQAANITAANQNWPRLLAN